MLAEVGFPITAVTPAVRISRSQSVRGVVGVGVARAVGSGVDVRFATLAAAAGALGRVVGDRGIGVGELAATGSPVADGGVSTLSAAVAVGLPVVTSLTGAAPEPQARPVIIVTIRTAPVKPARRFRLNPILNFNSTRGTISFWLSELPNLTEAVRRRIDGQCGGYCRVAYVDRRFPSSLA